MKVRSVIAEPACCLTKHLQGEGGGGVASVFNIDSGHGAILTKLWPSVF